MADGKRLSQRSSSTSLDVDAIIEALLSFRESKRQVELPEDVIKSLCRAAGNVLLEQPCLLQLGLPMTICGDIRGQYYDLLRLFELGGYPPEVNYLFLGNYVDIDKLNVETICLLMCYKIKYPVNFFLLRGTHESASVSRRLGFLDECKRRYSTALWKTFVDCFNHLPVAAIVDGKIFCTHGGLSPELCDLRQIERIVRPAVVPDNGLLYDMLWAQPDRHIVGWEKSDREMSSTFGENVVRDFLSAHDLDLICRANQLVEDGYEFFAKRRLVTLFSAPACGEHTNSGAMMTVDETLMCGFQILRPFEEKPHSAPAAEKGGSAEGEKLDSPMTQEQQQPKQQQQQQTTVGNGEEDETSVSRRPPKGGEERGQSLERSYPAFRAQISNFRGLDKLTNENLEALEDVKRLADALGGGSSSLRELDRLVTLANELEDMVSGHTEDMGMRRKELALPAFSQAYYTAVRSGICNAYLAASVIGSSLVSTSKTGGMAKAGKALKLLSGISLVGGLAGVAAAALEAGDRYVQTRRIIKITGLAPDAVECCTLARRLGLRLTDGLSEGAITEIDDEGHGRVHIKAAVGYKSGGCEPNLGTAVAQGAASEEAVLEWFVEELANYEAADLGSEGGAPAVQRGRRLGKRHLSTLLKAMGQDCLEGTHSTEKKIDRLLLVILPEAISASESERLTAQPLVPAPSHGGRLAPMAGVAAIRVNPQESGHDKSKQHAVLEAAKSDTGKKQPSLQALKAEQERQQAETKALKSGTDKQQAETRALKAEKDRQQAAMEVLRAEKCRQQADMEALKAEKERQQAAMETLKRDKERQQAEIEALRVDSEKQRAAFEAFKSEKERQQAEIEALKIDKEKHQAQLKAFELDKKKLLNKVNSLDKRFPKPLEETDASSDDIGDGHVLGLKKRVDVTKTAGEFWENAQASVSGAENCPEKPGLSLLHPPSGPALIKAATDDHHPVTKSQLREVLAVQDEKHRESDEKHREHEANYDQLQGGAPPMNLHE